MIIISNFSKCITPYKMLRCLDSFFSQSRICLVFILSIKQYLSDLDNSKWAWSWSSFKGFLFFSLPKFTSILVNQRVGQFYFLIFFFSSFPGDGWHCEEQVQMWINNINEDGDNHSSSKSSVDGDYLAIPSLSGL